MPAKSCVQCGRGIKQTYHRAWGETFGDGKLVLCVRCAEQYKFNPYGGVEERPEYRRKVQRDMFHLGYSKECDFTLNVIFEREGGVVEVFDPDRREIVFRSSTRILAGVDLYTVMIDTIKQHWSSDRFDITITNENFLALYEKRKHSITVHVVAKEEASA